jgi:putative inorganic carbon (hco3(-)) transporter
LTATRTWTLWAAAAATGALMAAAAVGVGHSRGAADGFLALCAVLLAVGGVVAAALVAPAVTISAGVALEIFSGEFSHLGSPVGLDRVVVVAGIVAAVVRDVRSDAPRLRINGLHVLLLAIAVYGLLSALFVHQLVSNSVFGLFDYLGFIPFALFLVAPLAFPGERERRVLLGTLVGVGLYLGITAVLETTGPSSLILPRYIANPHVGIHFGRARGPFVEAAGNGLAMYGCAVAAAIALRQWRRARWIPLLALLLCIFGVIYTLTRQVWLAAVVGTFVGMLARRELRVWLVPALLAGALVVGGAFAVAPGFGSRADKRVNDRRPVWDRLNSDDAALRMIADKPLLGHGWYTFGTESLDYYRQAPDRPVTTVERVHNVFLSYAAELGVLMLVAWVIAIGLALAGGLRRRGPPDLDDWRSGLVAFAVAWAVVANFTPMGYAFVHSLLWLMAGMTWSRT